VNKPRVLIIDDNADHLEILQIELGQRYQALTALDGIEGYVLATNDDVAAIVLDVNMPVLDGWTVCKSYVPIQRPAIFPSSS
jgi:DNA-binding response OmpR family regulator